MYVNSFEVSGEARMQTLVCRASESMLLRAQYVSKCGRWTNGSRIVGDACKMQIWGPPEPNQSIWWVWLEEMKISRKSLCIIKFGKFCFRISKASWPLCFKSAQSTQSWPHNLWGSVKDENVEPLVQKLGKNMPLKILKYNFFRPLYQEKMQMVLPLKGIIESSF